MDVVTLKGFLTAISIGPVPVTPRVSDGWIDRRDIICGAQVSETTAATLNTKAVKPVVCSMSCFDP